MSALTNLTYQLKIHYVDNSGANVVIYKKICDNGLEVKSIQVGDICVTEETIAGRVLSGKYEDKKTVCGYRYHYEKDGAEYLENINEKVPLASAINMINKTKMTSAFLSAKMTFVSISRSDKVFSINDGTIDVEKTAFAEDNQSQLYQYKESSLQTKTPGDETFFETSKTCIYQIDDSVVESPLDVDKENFSTLAAVVDKTPTTYKELIETKTTTQTQPTLDL